MIGGTYMAIMNTTTEMPAIARVVMNWSESAVGGFGKPKEDVGSDLGDHDQRHDFMPTENA